MNTKILFVAGAFVLAGSSLRAEFSVNSVVINAKSDPRNAPAIVAMASIENPKYTLSLVRAATRAMGNHAVAIVLAVLKVDPKDAPEIVRQAILGQPTLALQIANAAVAAVPDQRAAILRSASDAAPADARTSIEALEETTPSSLPNSTLTGGSPAAPSFPSQPVDAGLISPSS
jgi:hypothetical protein